jgi:hypothetical protein
MTSLASIWVSVVPPSLAGQLISTSACQLFVGESRSRFAPPDREIRASPRASIPRNGPASIVFAD